MREERQARIIKRSIVGLIVLFIVGYAGTRVFAFLQGPSLVILSPKDYEVVEAPLVLIRGSAARVAKIHINGREIFTNEQGIFEDRLLVAPGYSIMAITAEDSFHRSITKTIHIVRE